MNSNIPAIAFWLVIGIMLLVFILKHNVGKVLRRILITYGVLGVVFAASLFTLSHEILIILYHAWVTTLIFIIIMVVLAVGGK